MPTIKFVTEGGKYVAEGHPDAAYRVNMDDKDSGKFVDGLRKKSGYVAPSEQVVPEESAKESEPPAEPAKTAEASKEPSEPVKVAEKPAKR